MANYAETLRNCESVRKITPITHDFIYLEGVYMALFDQGELLHCEGDLHYNTLHKTRIITGAEG